MKKITLLSGVLLGLIMLMAIAAAVTADDSEPISDDEVNKIASQLYCPICENVPLDVCSTQACANWRELIRQFLADGKSEDEIKAYFSTQYGWNVLSVPPRVGLNWFIYVFPPLITVGSIMLVVMIIHKSKLASSSGGDKVHPTQPSEIDEYLKIIDSDLKNEERNG